MFGRLYQGVGAPGFRRVAGFNIAVQGSERFHLGIFPRRNIVACIADIDTFPWLYRRLFAGSQHGLDMGLGVSCSIATDDAGGSIGEFECIHQRVGKAFPFIGDDTPFQVLALQWRQASLTCL